MASIASSVISAEVCTKMRSGQEDSIVVEALEGTPLDRDALRILKENGASAVERPVAPARHPPLLHVRLRRVTEPDPCKRYLQAGDRGSDRDTW